MAYNRLQKQTATSVGDIPLEQQLAGQTNDQDTSIDGLKNTDKLLHEVRANADLIDTTEVQLDDTREKLAEQMTVEGKLGKSKQRQGEYNPVVRSLDLLNHAQAEERLKEFKKAQAKRDTEFWDKYVGEDADKLIKKQVDRGGKSQLQNHPDRFSKLTTDPTAVADKVKVKDMITASLKDSDAMLLHIYYKAASAGRELTTEESKMVQKISSDKVNILTAQLSPEHLAQRIERLQHALQNVPVNSPDHDRMRHELESLIEQGRQHTSGGTSSMVEPFLR